jgi:hypothetical protein
MTEVQTFKDMEQSNFEDAVAAALLKRIGWEIDVYESANLGVVAVARLEGSDRGKVDWQEVAAELARETGVGVTCIANCDWSFDDRPDEEATFIAFACPGVPDGYRDDAYRNQIRAVDPDTAPSQQDFDDARRARKIVAAHLRELDGLREKLIAAGKSDHEATDAYIAAEELKDVTAFERDAVKAVLALDFAGAVASLPKDPESPAPRM